MTPGVRALLMVFAAIGVVLLTALGYGLWFMLGEIR